MNAEKKAKDLRLGVNILVILAVLTLVEYVVAVWTGMWLLLVVLAFVKAAIVLQFFMHLPRVFSEEGGH